MTKILFIILLSFISISAIAKDKKAIIFEKNTPVKLYRLGGDMTNVRENVDLNVDPYKKAVGHNQNLVEGISTTSKEPSGTNFCTIESKSKIPKDIKLIKDPVDSEHYLWAPTKVMRLEAFKTLMGNIPCEPKK
ncbi:hypothetical protein RHO12_03245 [Orbus sturtevantii]|uniref:hypothetical protein n=1 Tax=Orbus sturtevantii TaxID=3074109 RepID=UPI00370D02C5